MGIGNGDFACPGGSEGVRCMSARQIYQATESSDYVKTVSENEKSGNEKAQSAHSGGYGRPVSAQVAVPRIDQPIPIRTQAQVMRIWTSSWEDDEGDLHADGYMYTEIESRRWNLGDRFTSPGSAISPLSTPTPSSTAK
jgi:conjugal transfer pilus assembly protein TraV